AGPSVPRGQPVEYRDGRRPASFRPAFRFSRTGCGGAEGRRPYIAPRAVRLPVGPFRLPLRPSRARRLRLRRVRRTEPRLGRKRRDSAAGSHTVAAAGAAAAGREDSLLRVPVLSAVGRLLVSSAFAGPSPARPAPARTGSALPKPAAGAARLC